MRTKTLLCAALLAASAATTMAQSNVYSLNVVGYIQVPIKGGFSFNMLANPLNNTNNDINNLFQNGGDGDQIQTWDANIQDVGSTYTYSAFSHAWDGNRIIKPGEGFFYFNQNNDYTNTFVGDVIQGSYVNPVGIKANFSFNMIGSSIPLGFSGNGTFTNYAGTSFTNAIVGVNSADGDQVQVWNVDIQDVGDTATYSAFSHAWDNPNIIVNNGGGFFYFSQGDTDQPVWTRNYTVQ